MNDSVVIENTNDGRLRSSYDNVGTFKITYMVTLPNSNDHDGRIKIGDAFYHTNKTVEQIIAESDPKMLEEHGIITTPEIEQAAHKRIKEWTGTADLKYVLEVSGLNVSPTKIVQGKQQYEAFRDYEIHDVLIRSGFKKRFVRDDKKTGEWFDIDVPNAIESLKARINNKDRFLDVKFEFKPIELRNEQKGAVRLTKRCFKGGTIEEPKSSLWNAIMRFGKTVTAYSLVKEIQESENVNKVLIITHRPIVSAGWSEDFLKVFGIDSDWQFGAKKKEHGILWENIEKTMPFFYFASIQDLRGSFYNTDDESKKDTTATDIKKVEQDFDNIAKLSKNKEIFETEFDMVVIDEGHEGTSTELAKKLMSEIKARYKLHLSGTPFNIIEDFAGEDEVFNWTYVDERKANENWVKARNDWDLYEKTGGEKPAVPYPGEVNPYGKLPEIEIRTMNVDKIISEKEVKEIIKRGNKVEFTFSEFFKVDESKTLIGHDGKTTYHPFVNNKAVMRFINALFQNDEYENSRRGLPFGSNLSKELFAHTFWMLPNVDAAVTLKEMIEVSHSEFTVVNATADNHDGDALEAVRDAINNNPYTITLSVGKLTTGTTVPEWTGVFMLTDMSSPMLYLQTIFRVKSSGSLKDGRQKEVGYVFDFAPNRCLKMISQSAVLSVSKKDNKGKDKTFVEIENDEIDSVKETLNYLPVLSYNGTYFEENDSNSFMQALNRVYIQESVEKGFASSRLYSFDIHNISQAAAKALLEVGEIVKASGYDDKNKNVTISESELTTSEKQALEKDDKGEDLTKEEKKELTSAEKKLKNDRDNARKIVSILTGVAIRIPLLVFAHNDKGTITLENFSEIIDDDSWEEFMPKGFTKKNWSEVSQYFNRVVFEGSCAEIINRVRKMDMMTPLERVAAIAHLFSTFKNPDKETVLTPWHVISMQVSQTLGGLRYVDENGQWFCNDGFVHSWEEIEDSLGELVRVPKFVNPYENDDCKVMFNQINDMWNSTESTFYDINSKTALYPLFATATLFKKQLDKAVELLGRDLSLAEQKKLWAEIVERQIFVNTRVEYSATIAQRVLLGYNEEKKINSSVVDVIALRNALKTVHKDESNANLKLKQLSADDINSVIAWVLMGVKDKVDMGYKERLALLDTNIQEALKKAEENDDKFTAVLSNPPYNADNGSSSDAIYQHFMNTAKLIGRKISMIYPVKWVNSGRGEGIDDFREKEVNSNNYVSFHVISEGEKVFKSANISGGINYFLWADKKVDETIFSYNEKTQIRKTIIHNLPVVVLNSNYMPIVEKTKTVNSFSTYPREYYGSTFSTNAVNIEKLKDSNGDIFAYYFSSNRKIEKIQLSKNTTTRETNDYKVFVSKTAHYVNNSLARADRILTASPNEICSSTFLKVGSYKTKNEALNTLLYLKTNFATFLFGVTQLTQNSSSKNYSLIPDVDFATGEIKDKPGVFLDFDSPDTLDEQLAKIYELTEDEQKLMKNSIKPWKDKLSLTADGLY